MNDADAVLRLAADLVAIDSRSSVSNLAVAERIEAELTGFDVERVDYADANGVAKRALVAHRGPQRRLRAVRPHGHGARHRLDRPLDARAWRMACCMASAAST